MKKSRGRPGSCHLRSACASAIEVAPAFALQAIDVAFVTQRFARVAHVLLQLALDLAGLPAHGGAAVAGHLADLFLDAPGDLVGDALDLLLVHAFAPL